MLVQLGQRAASEDVADLLVECHVRIRTFLGFARRLAATLPLPAAEVRTVAGQVHRYFAVAFPLHLADEEELLRVYLAGHGETVARALATMHDDHAAHEPAVSHLVELCAELERDPARHAALAPELAAATDALIAALEPHLALEERDLFPVLRTLPQPERDEIRAAMRARRDDSLSGGGRR